MAVSTLSGGIPLGSVHLRRPVAFNKVADERSVDLDQRLLLLRAQARIGMDVDLEITLGICLEDAGSHIKRLSGDGQALCDLLEDLR